MKNALFVLLLVFAGCVASAQQYRVASVKRGQVASPQHQVNSAPQYVIQAKLTGFKDGTKFYLKDTDMESYIDSAVLKNGQLQLKGHLTESPKDLSLSTTIGKDYYYTILFIGNDKVTIAGDIKDFPFSLQISGPKTQQDQTKVLNLIKDGMKERNRLVEGYFALKGDSAAIKGKEIWAVIAKIDSADRAVRMRYINENLNSYYALNELFYLAKEYPAEKLKQMYNSLKPEFKNSRYGQRVERYLIVGKTLEKGDDMVDFVAQDKEGLSHKLSDMKGKYVLLDFSSTYCGPCIQSVQDLNILYKKYAGQLELITFSCDGGKEIWLKGEARDQPSWLSLWDGQGNYGKTILKYGVEGYPTFVLIDPKGKIVDKWSGFGKDPGEKGSLETKVDDLIALK